MARRKTRKTTGTPMPRAMKLAEVITPHRAQHDSFEVVTTVERADAKSDFMERAQTKRNVTMLPIDRYHRRKLLDDLQYEAALRLHADYGRAIEAARVVGRYSDMVGLGSVQDHRVNQSAAERDYQAAMAFVGRGGFEVLRDVVCIGNEAGTEWRMQHLRQMLDLLVIHYEI
jgi:hypothetical protein